MIIRDNRFPFHYILGHGVFELLVPVAQEEHFELEAPVIHILIELVQERILFNNLFNDRKLKLSRQHGSKGSLSGPDRALYCNKRCMFH
ncbi:hypothetical protein D3C72_2235340 [compost metagenome]